MEGRDTIQFSTFHTHTQPLHTYTQSKHTNLYNKIVKVELQNREDHSARQLSSKAR